MAIAVRCEACQIEASAVAPAELRVFLDRHRDPDECAERIQGRTELAIRLPRPLRRTA